MSQATHSRGEENTVNSHRVKKARWPLRGAIALGVILVGLFSRPVWIPAVGRSLVCREAVLAADAILVDNVESNYLLFERAAELQRAGVARRVLVPTPASSDPAVPNLVSAGVVEVMTKVARLDQPELVPFRELEPVTLNVAFQVRDALQDSSVRSVIVVTSGFRSRRSSLVYARVFGEAGIVTYCVPVFGTQTVDRWPATWHGIQHVVEQHLKLLYYRLYVLGRGWPNDKPAQTDSWKRVHGPEEKRRVSN